MTRLAHFVAHHRLLVIGTWLVLTVFGAFAAGKLSDRWLEDFSIPGAEGYEANQRAVQELGNGEVFPLVLVLRADGDVTKVAGVEQAIERAAAASPGSRVSSYFNTRDDVYVSDDRKVTFANVYPAGQYSFEGVDLTANERGARGIAAARGRGLCVRNRRAVRRVERGR